MSLPSSLVLVVGCVGVGKSQFINTMNSNSDCSVSHELFTDGTQNFQKSGKFIDTPGLDSHNFPWETVADKIRKYGNDFQIILVLDGHMSRANSFVKLFERLLGEFQQQKFSIVWTKVAPSSSKMEELSERFQEKLELQFNDHDQQYSPTGCSGCSAVPLKPEKIVEKQEPVMPLGPAVVGKSKGKSKADMEVLKGILLSSPLTGLIKCLGKTIQTSNIPPINNQMVYNICEKVVNTTDKEVHRMRVIGDCLLDLIIYMKVLKRGLKPDNLSEFKKPIICNDGFMPKFVDTHFAKLPGFDVEFNSNHAKADCFEAILAYASFGGKEIRIGLDSTLQLMFLCIGEEVERIAKSSGSL